MRTLTDEELHTLNTHAALIDETASEIHSLYYEWSRYRGPRSVLDELVRNELAVLVARVTEAYRCQA